MNIAVINSGSSSLKCKLFDMEKREVIQSFKIENIGEEGSEYPNHHAALKSLGIPFHTLDAIGHRVVHGGEDFLSSVVINEDVLEKIKELSPLAPLHNPSNLEGIRVVMKKAPEVVQIAVFDTAFHSTMPEESYLYALSHTMHDKYRIRRYGFHGTSHHYVAKKAAEILGKDLSKLNLITLHLGNGASACAIKNGQSIDTSMGFTPLEGLVMGSRSGDLDPAIILYMQRELGMSVDEVSEELNKNSGLFGICGENDVRSIIQREDKNAKLAINMMVRRIQKYIGSYMVLLEDIDAIVFTGGIGEHSEYIREKILSNKRLKSLPHLVIETDEELEIADECIQILKKV